MNILAIQNFLPNLMRFIPSFRKMGLISKITITIFLAGICCDLFYAKVNQAIPIIKGILAFSPYKEAETLYKEDKLPSALNYIKFYESIPGYTPPKELLDLKTKIVHERNALSVDGALYHARQIGKAAMGHGSDEIYGNAVDAAIDFTSVGDVRDLYKEYQNYRTGEEVDALAASVASIGLFTSLASFTPAVAVMGPIKATIAPIKKGVSALKGSMRKALLEVLEPIGSMIRKSKVLDDINSTSFTNSQKLGETFWKKKKQIGRLLKDIDKQLNVFGNFGVLAKKDPLIANRVLRCSTNMKELRDFADAALKLGKDSAEMIKIGGKDLLEAAVSLEKKGKLNTIELKQSLRFGQEGPKALQKGISFKKLSDRIERLNNSALLLCIFMLQWLLSLIPWIVVFCLWLFLILVIIKSWDWRFINRKAQ